MTNGVPFPFLVGCWRSGTTLLRSVFDSHPELAVPPESGFLTEVIAGFDGERFDPTEFAAFVASAPRFRAWGLADGMLEAAFRREQPGSLADAVRLTFATYAAAKGKHRYGDKTPSYLIEMGSIGRLLPEARFVHLIRDGRDVASALAQAPFGPASIEEAALHWRSRIRSGRRQGAALGPGRYLEVRYEELVAEPAEVLPRVCGFLDLAYRDAMLDHTASAHSMIATTMYPGVHGNTLQEITKGLRDWRRDMTPDDVVRFELLAGDVLDELGYERSGRKASAVRRLDLLGRRGGLELKRASRRVRRLGSASWW